MGRVFQKTFFQKTVARNLDLSSSFQMLSHATPGSTLSSKQVVPHPSMRKSHKRTLWIQTQRCELKLGPHRSISVQLAPKWHSWDLGPDPGAGTGTVRIKRHSFKRRAHDMYIYIYVYTEDKLLMRFIPELAPLWFVAFWIMKKRKPASGVCDKNHQPINMSETLVPNKSWSLCFGGGLRPRWIRSHLSECTPVTRPLNFDSAGK